MTQRILQSALVYWAIVFGLGFVLGTIRVLVVVPWLGSDSLAIAAELPVMLAASWFAARWLVGRFGPFSASARALVGGLAFVLVMVAEAVLAVALFGQTFAAWLASQVRMPGLMGLGAQMLFGLMPLLVAGNRHRPGD